MKTAYRERDYAFGQRILTLRTAIGLTQEGLAKYLGVSRRAVGEWETGNSYPKASHLKELIALGVKDHAFPQGSEERVIRELWKMVFIGNKLAASEASFYMFEDPFQAK
jgi:transcriptional regulator with XRE-family HTH domain